MYTQGCVYTCTYELVLDPRVPDVCTHTLPVLSSCQYSCTHRYLSPTAKCTHSCAVVQSVVYVYGRTRVLSIVLNLVDLLNLVQFKFWFISLQTGCTVN